LQGRTKDAVYPSKQEKDFKMNWKTKWRKIFGSSSWLLSDIWKCVLCVCIAGCRSMCEIFGSIFQFENDGSVRAL